MAKRFFEWTGLFESNLTAAEWLWRIFTWIIITGGGTTAGLLARASDLFSATGPIGSFAIGIFAALIIALIFYLTKLGNRQSAQADYMRELSLRESPINPLLESFADKIIHVSDLHLPWRQSHTNKQFKRCKFVGPGAIGIIGGSYMYSGFIQVDIIPLPDNTSLQNIVFFQNCTVESCEFIGVAIFTNKDIATKLLASPRK